MEELYDTYARLYDIIYYKEEQYQREVDFLINVKPDDSLKILDLCGGTGSHANLLVKKGHQVVVVDRSLPMLEIARKKNSSIKTINEDICKYKTKEKFDLITCMYGAIHYTESISQLKKLIQNSLKMLKKNGKVIFDLRYFKNLPENNQLDYNNGYWNRKFFKIGKGVKSSDIYVVTAFNCEEHFMDVHNLYHCDPFFFHALFLEAGFKKVDLFENYSLQKSFDEMSKSDIAVLVAQAE